uniref:Tyr recombinase domain-containing protein n=1 Tax=Knipowitschia caucasica TaxID=637954 RepID=A0AAV2J1N3_KNICA
MGIATRKHSRKKRLILVLSCPRSGPARASTAPSLQRPSPCINPPSDCSGGSLRKLRPAFSALGFLHSGKTTGPANALEFPGIRLDTRAMEASLPLDKLERIRAFSRLLSLAGSVSSLNVVSARTRGAAPTWRSGPVCRAAGMVHLFFFYSVIILSQMPRGSSRTQPRPWVLGVFSGPVVRVAFPRSISSARHEIYPVTVACVPRNHTAQLKSVLLLCNLSPHLYTAHSFRIGAATRAASLGLPHSALQQLGRWSSSALSSYIRPDTSTILAAQRLLASP